MRLVCSECEAPFIIRLANAERFPIALCPGCRRHQERVSERELPPLRLYGVEVNMGRWWGGEIPHYNRQGRRD